VSSEIQIKLNNTAQNFRAGKTGDNIAMWETMTTDQWILNTIKGYSVEITSTPKQVHVPSPFAFSEKERKLIASELDRFLECGIIELATDDMCDEFISNIFIRPKKDGRVRIILNLKVFNEYHVEKIHFKMESLRSAIAAMRKNGYMASVDISDAFYSINIREQDRKYFRFIFGGIKYQFTALVQGSCSPRVWTKIMKPIFSYLRQMGHTSVYFIDDSWLFAKTFNACLRNVEDTVKLMDRLGLTINMSKSVLVPCTKLVFLGFVLCSETMTVRLTQEKMDDIILLCTRMIKTKRTTIREFAKLVGKLTAAEPGVQHAPLFIRPLEKVKEEQLKVHCGNFDSFMTIPRSIDSSLNWWVAHVKDSYKNVSIGPANIIIFSDASQRMFGAYDKTHNVETKGFWSPVEQCLHINVLELKACENALKAFCENVTNSHVRIYTDNTTSCSYINRYGGKFRSLDDVARRLWMWCIERNIYLSASHIAGISNKHADRLSRTGNDDTEWSLDKTVFAKLLEIYPDMSVDLFASNLNAKLCSYVSRYPDCNAGAVDAFSFQWVNTLYYIFAPFSLIGRVLQKIEEDKAQAIIIAPFWTTQPWWPTLVNLVKGPCYLLPKPHKILKLEHKPKTRYHLIKTRLIVFNISGRRCDCREYQKTLKFSSLNRGEKVPGTNTTHILKNGFVTANGQQIPVRPLHWQL